jgi:hypothetical protein
MYMGRILVQRSCFRGEREGVAACAGEMASLEGSTSDGKVTLM